MFKAPRIVVILGGGPSLADVPRYLIERPFVLCCNNAYLLRNAPTVVVAMDARWIAQHVCALLARGDEVYTKVSSSPIAKFHYFKADKESPLSESWDRAAGLDTGYVAINLAYLAGAKEIILAGFDMGFRGERSHWHDGHPIPTSESNYTRRFKPTYAKLDSALRQRRVNLWQLPGSDVGRHVRRLSYCDAAKALGICP